VRLDTAPRAGLKPAERETLSDLAAVVVDAMELRIAAGRIQAENTRRREAETAVREAHENLQQAWSEVERERERYKELFTFAPDGYLVTDPEGTIREANEATARMLNVLPESLSGKAFVHFVVEPEHHNFRTLLRRLQSVDRVHDWEVRLKPRGAPPFVAAVTGGAVRGTGGESLTLRWMVRDITERKQAEEERYRLLSEGRADQPIILLDAAGAPVGWSAPAERLWMGRAEPDEGSTAPRLFPEEGPEKKRLERSLMVASSEGRFDEEGWRLRRDGTRFWAHEVILPLRDGQGRLKSFVCFARDLTAGRRTDSA
jgi:PAS domain S-box-containing protein